MAEVNVAAILAVAEPLALDLLALFRRRQAEGADVNSPSFEQEVIARAKGKAQAIVAEGTAALTEFPDDAPLA
jgi:hypothetical protein